MLNTRIDSAVVVLSLMLSLGCGGGGGGGVGPPDDAAGAVDSLVLSLDSAEVILEDTVRLTAVPRDANGEPIPGLTLVWTSTDPTVATVSSDGLVTAIELGEAEIEVDVAGASARESSAALQLAGTAAQRRRSRAWIFSVPKLVITPGEQSVDVGATVQYTATITNRNDRELRNRPETGWRSSDPAVATIDAAGTATAIKEGTTQISAAVTVGRAYNFRRQVLLRVTACAGIADVEEWAANVQVTYEGTASAGDLTLSVSQQSSGSARLLRMPTDNGVTLWEGRASGQASLDNSIIPAGGGSTTEKGSGSLGGDAIIQLRVFPAANPTERCRYQLRYMDHVSYTSTITSRPGPITPPPQVTPLSHAIGVARSRETEVGVPPAGSAWRLVAEETIPGRLILRHPDPVDDDLAVLPITHGYFPVTTIGASLFAADGDPDASIGSASLNYSVVAR